MSVLNQLSNHSTWLFISLVATFGLGYSFGIGTGRRKERTEQTLYAKKMEATKMWTEAFGKYMGGKDGR